VAQTLAWASTYYLPAMLARPMAASVGLATADVHAAFSAAMGVSALLGPWAGRHIDRHGGRPLLMASSGLAALGLLLLAGAQGPIGLLAGWLVLGLVMGIGLYDAAFSALVWLHGPAARGAITGVTLFGGLASTVGWPLSAWLVTQHGWREACLAWAALHLLLGLPLNASLPRRRDGATRRSTPVDAPTATPPTDAPASPSEVLQAPLPDAAPPRHTGLLLAWVFAVTWFVSTAMAAHLPQLLQDAGMTLAGAVAIGALVGPAQVAGRLLEFGWLRRWHPLLSARLAALSHPAGVAALAVLGLPGAAAFALLHGAGNGILTIAKGTLPLALFGATGYGARQGWLTLPARLAQGLAPWLFGLALARWGHGAMLLSAGLALSSLAALLMLRAPASRPR
jgi:predicted MFS family arabinose efflux permease